ncbi:hypothetical protein SISNIDRAFT_463228 [Sistotremastrum niveocremeum HHB9708]|uniref:Uncharacterized protein n=1 Tax=Sistotremastrum niveocremeum HHB9708 TaxID=1314777 RepID=A0A164YWS9_9AGAM|nr:hypothetical protein SISNIDRAFT_463228 [Sistotremastrum niveocremeum HHB9708]
MQLKLAMHIILSLASILSFSSDVAGFAIARADIESIDDFEIDPKFPNRESSLGGEISDGGCRPDEDYEIESTVWARDSVTVSLCTPWRMGVVVRVPNILNFGSLSGDMNTVRFHTSPFQSFKSNIDKPALDEFCFFHIPEIQ